MHRFESRKAKLSLEEQQAVQQGIDKFKSGWYIDAEQFFYFGTFYSPVSPLFTALMWIVIYFPYWCFPVTSRKYYVLRSLCGKDNQILCLAILYMVMFPLLLLYDMFILLVIVFVFPILLLGLLLVELALFFCGLCYYRCGRLRESSVFVLRWKVKLIVSRVKKCVAGRILITISLGDTVNISLTRASLCRSMFCNRLAGIFRGINWLTYGYGDIDSVEQLTADEMQMYQVLKQKNRHDFIIICM